MKSRTVGLRYRLYEWNKGQGKLVAEVRNNVSVHATANLTDTCRINLAHPRLWHPDSPYIALPDKGNCRNLVSSPFTFTGITWQEGELKAIGYSQGVPVTEHVVRTPGLASHLDISYFESGASAATDDLLIIYVCLLDSQKTLTFTDNMTRVALEVLEGGTVIGPVAIEAEAGTASFLVKTGTEKRLVMKATSGGLSALKRLDIRK